MASTGRPAGVVAVCADAEVATALIGQGARVLWCAPDGTDGTDATGVADTVVRLRAVGGAIAVLVGDLADPEVQTAARAMAAELFGGDPIVVSRASDTGQEKPGPPGSDEGGSGTV